MRSVLFALALVPALISGAQAQDTRFAMVAFSNPTHVTLHYQFKWGDDSWRSFSVEPGEVHWHSWTYLYPGQNHSPTPYVRFDQDMSPVVDMVAVRVAAYAAPSQDTRYAKTYEFRLINGGDWLTLVGVD